VRTLPALLIAVALLASVPPLPCFLPPLLPPLLPEAQAGDTAKAAKRLLDDDDPAARAAAVRRLSGVVASGRLDPAVRSALVAALSDGHPYVRGAAAGVVGAILDPPSRAWWLSETPRWKDAHAREAMTEAFAVWADGDGRTGLLRLLGDPAAAVRAAAALRLADDPDAAAGAALSLAAADDADGLVRATAIDALVARRRLRGVLPAAVPLEAAARDRDPRVRLSALEGSVAMGGEAAMVAVLHGLDDAVWSVRLVAAESAGAVRHKKVLAPLIAALRDPRDRVAQAAGVSLVRLTGIPFDAHPARWQAWLEGDGATFDPAVSAARAPPPFDPGGSTVAPVRFLDVPVASSHVAFVLDASGSMREPMPGGGTRWDRMREEVDRVLGVLGTSAEGNVFLFSDAAEAVFPKATRFSPSARTQVRDRLAARPPGGKTALYDGIALALRDPEVDSIIVLSDGAPSAGERFTKTDVLEGVRRANRWRRARIDVVGVGSAEVAKRWRTLLKDIAEETGGRYLER
jgi:HEAT repeat protein